ncbi:uncharacterized protein MELLADRAFT_92818 [Melampsora larici-populina 98AG31]|uniref:Uncharacterized protein n=1 Tax=Melampsora larici-populina (strain 98AG31 / pathotype 3-4-7) TaxID=747676 RepID=F4S2V0_MELLP|nr:uncharacterized protein MELLADRAFT_92818 [Melampsora larici-populina 98AG31]EGG01062.1 hypothetical protein MELLADRAFT_92818 [Melampsora larici-populina 98AG31]
MPTSTGPSTSKSLAPPSSTPVRQLRNRSPQQPSPGFVLTGSDSRRRITREGSNPASHPTTPVSTSKDSAKRGREEANDDEPDLNVTKKRKTVPKPKGTKDKGVPTVVNVDQDSSGDENEAVETRPGHRGDVKELMRYYGAPKHYKDEVSS